MARQQLYTQEVATIPGIIKYYHYHYYHHYYHYDYRYNRSRTEITKTSRMGGS